PHSAAAPAHLRSPWPTRARRRPGFLQVAAAAGVAAVWVRVAPRSAPPARPAPPTRPPDAAPTIRDQVRSAQVSCPVPLAGAAARRHAIPTLRGTATARFAPDPSPSAPRSQAL